MKELLMEIVNALVEKPDEVEVKELKGNSSTVLELKVAKTDMGRVIGKEGHIVIAIRNILSAVGGKEKRRYQFEIIEPK